MSPREVRWVEVRPFVRFRPARMKKKGWEGGKNKGNLGRMKKTPLRKLRVDLADVENDRIHLKRSTPVGNRIGMIILITKREVILRMGRMMGSSRTEAHRLEVELG